MKVLVNTNALRASDVISQARETANIINADLIPALERIGIKATEDVLKDCLDNADKTEADYFKGLASDLKVARTPAIKNQMYRTAEEEYIGFQRVLSATRSQVRHSGFLSVIDGVCVLTEEAEKSLADQAALYITDPDEIASYHLHLEIVEKLNKFFSGSIPPRWYTLFGVDSEGWFFRNENTEYSKFANHGK